MGGEGGRDKHTRVRQKEAHKLIRPKTLYLLPLLPICLPVFLSVCLSVCLSLTLTHTCCYRCGGCAGGGKRQV